MTQTKLSDFGDDLADIRMDGKLGWAGVKDAEPMTKEAYFEDVEPGDDDADVPGLSITFETASGREFSDWFPKPTEWDPVMSNLVLLLEFWEIHPGEIERLIDEGETFEIPYDAEADAPDWAEIERTIHTRQLEEADDGPD